MKHASLVALSALLLSTTLATAAQAQDYLSANLGYYDIVRDKHDAAQFGLEYRFGDIGYNFHPIAGAFITSDDSKYAYAGLNWNAALIQNRLYLVPSFAVGAYSQGDGKDLGGTLEFRSGIELDYQFDNAQQLGIAFNHISNASIYDHNPGVETLMVTYSIPLNTVGSWFK